MNLLKSALKEREKDVEEKNARRIDDIKIRKTEQKNRLIAKIQRKKINPLNAQKILLRKNSLKSFFLFFIWILSFMSDLFFYQIES